MQRPFAFEGNFKRTVSKRDLNQAPKENEPAFEANFGPGCRPLISQLGEVAVRPLGGDLTSYPTCYMVEPGGLTSYLKKGLVMNKIALEFPFIFKSLDNHPDDGKIFQQMLESVLKTKLTITELDFNNNDKNYAWEFDLSEKPYFMIFFYDKDYDKWIIENGFYIKKEAEEEIRSLKDSAPRGQKGHYKIFNTIDNKIEIDKLINKLNKIPTMSQDDIVINYGLKYRVTKINLDKGTFNASNSVYRPHTFKIDDFKWSVLHQVWRR